MLTRKAEQILDAIKNDEAWNNNQYGRAVTQCAEWLLDDYSEFGEYIYALTEDAFLTGQDKTWELYLLNHWTMANTKEIARLFIGDKADDAFYANTDWRAVMAAAMREAMCRITATEILLRESGVLCEDDRLA